MVDDPLAVLDEFDNTKARLEDLAEELDGDDWTAVGETEIDGETVGDRHELRLHVYYAPPDRGDGTPSWTVPLALLTWADENGLLLRSTLVLEDVGQMVAEFAPIEDTVHEPRATVVSELAALLDEGCTAAEALDYWATEFAGYQQIDWASVRGVGRQTISDRVGGAEESLAAERRRSSRGRPSLLALWPWVRRLVGTRALWIVHETREGRSNV